MVQTEKALLTLVGLGMQVKDALADDGKIDFGESIKISMKGVALIGVFKNLPAIKVELKNSTNEERLTLVEKFKQEFDLPNDAAEQSVEQAIEVLVNLANMIWGKEAA
jgi:hypothetical protein